MSMFSKGDSLIDEGCIEMRKKKRPSLKPSPRLQRPIFSNSKDQQYSPTAVPDSSSLPVTSWNRVFQDKFSFLNQVLIWYDSCRQKQTSAHPDAMLVYDNVETSNSREISKGDNKLTFIEKRKWLHRSFRHGFVNARSLFTVYSFFTTVFNQLRSANASNDSSSWFLGAALHSSSSTVSSHFACKVMLRKGR